ncbi:DUF3883 domain-containing protein [Winogradskyella echinorum]|uniref:DUF3883 domain-containing protein n=1 Tax=Winogradskyella echinorum TaxID=538189 RepID=A0ABR6Y4V5_9FLAO|nr:DUF3883 domain-containing protein [Winogradskyella echinorum]MBC3847725.1 DUF3883 domain-containing protein [Winogradskyella echinorum]MBC5752073.1 DUF3883 domain-containing protein [Winogradskyella echinorum]
METHFEILIDASGSMGYMRGEKDEENKYLLSDRKHTRTDLVKKILNQSIINTIEFSEHIKVSTFRNKFNLDKNNERIILTRWVKNENGKNVQERYYSMSQDINVIYEGPFNSDELKSKIETIENPMPAGTPLYYILAQTISKSITNQVNIIILSDGDANDRIEFDIDILELIHGSKKDVKIHFIGIAQDEVAQKKSKNLAEKTGGIYSNLKAMNYDVNALNVLLSELNTKIMSNALEDNIKQTQIIAATKLDETQKDNTDHLAKDEGDKSEKETNVIVKDKSDLEKQVHKNTSSLEYISGQLNNILKLLQSKEQLEKDVKVVENKIHNERIGRLAEDFLYKKLRELFKDESTKVSWLNENGEQGLPYDFLLESDKGKFYYECKGTSSNFLEFQLTKPEWDFYLDNRNKYRLCFVKNVDSDAQYTRFMDLLTAMEEKKLTPCSMQDKAYKANRLIFAINESDIKWT